MSKYTGPITAEKQKQAENAFRNSSVEAKANTSYQSGDRRVKYVCNTNNDAEILDRLRNALKELWNKKKDYSNTDKFVADFFSKDENKLSQFTTDPAPGIIPSAAPAVKPAAY